MGVRRLALLVLVVPLSGCAGSMVKAVDASKVALVALDVAVESASPAWRTYVEAQVERCKAAGVTTKAEGTGLGLPLVRMIVESHGGSVWYRSVPDQGAAFTVVLPTDR